jgi:hypothetical protein
MGAVAVRCVPLIGKIDDVLGGKPRAHVAQDREPSET